MARLEALVMSGEKRERDASLKQDICDCSAALPIKANVEQYGVKIVLGEFVTGHGNIVRDARNATTNSLHNLTDEMRYEMFMLNDQNTRDAASCDATTNHFSPRMNEAQTRLVSQSFSTIAVSVSELYKLHQPPREGA